MIKKLALLVSLALLPLATLSAKPKAQADFSEFKGNYTGTIIFSEGSESISFSGPASIRVAVPANGRSAVATISGNLILLNDSPPFFGTFTMKKSTLTGSNVIFNLVPGAGPFTVPGKLSRNGFKASGAITFDSAPALIQSTIKVKPLGKKRKRITITYVLFAQGASISFQFTAKARVRNN